MIQVHGLSKNYGARQAISNLSFEAKKGEIVGFLGPNGAGKTTTMRILAGYMPPTSGEAKVAGFDLLKESLDVRRRVGYLPETAPLYDDMTVFDFLKFMADLRNLPDANGRIAVTLGLVGMTERAGGYISNLSKGMRQRIGLAQALLHEPEVLILDEPTIGLDPAQVVEVRNLVREIGKERTVLLSTHVLSEAQQLCDRVLIINKGEIVAEDTPSNLQARLVGEERVQIRFRGDAENLVAKINAVVGVQHIATINDGLLEFQYSSGQDVRPEVARLIIESGCDLLEMRSLGMSLEEIFLQLTKDGAPEKGEFHA